MEMTILSFCTVSSGQLPYPIYREIAGFPAYYVGTDGSVWSKRRHATGGESLVSAEWKPLSLYRRPYGNRYVVVCLRAEPKGRVWQKYVHRLVLEAFVAELTANPN